MELRSMSPRAIFLQKQTAEWTACLNHGSLTALAFAYRLCPLFSSFALRNLKHLFSNAKITPMISSHSFQNTGTLQRFPAPWAQTQGQAPASEDLAGSQDGAGGQSITDRVLQHTQNTPREALRDPLRGPRPTCGLSRPGFTSISSQNYQAWNILGLISESLCHKQATMMGPRDTRRIKHRHRVSCRKSH